MAGPTLPSTDLAARFSAFCMSTSRPVGRAARSCLSCHSVLAISCLTCSASAWLSPRATAMEWLAARPVLVTCLAAGCSSATPVEAWTIGRCLSLGARRAQETCAEPTALRVGDKTGRTLPPSRQRRRAYPSRPPPPSRPPGCTTQSLWRSTPPRRQNCPPFSKCSTRIHTVLESSILDIHVFEYLP